MTRRSLRPGRAGFTFVELLIVIAIIGLLAALLLAGISKVSQLARTATVASDMSQLDAAAKKFNSDFGFFPPSTFTIPVKNSDPGFAVFKQMYPRWNPAVDMVGNITPALPNAGAVLNGNQSMVYFLGGPSQTGWATDQPLAPTAAATAIKPPYFDFRQDRLVAGNTAALGAFAAGMSALPVYLDTYKSPANGNLGNPYVYLASGTGGKYPPVACYGVNPFVESAINPVPPGGITKFVNQGGVQIVSAGEDGAFGPGCPLVGTTQCKYVAGQSAPVSGISPYGEGDQGADDIGNFNNGSKLGVGR